MFLKIFLFLIYSCHLREIHVIILFLQLGLLKLYLFQDLRELFFYHIHVMDLAGFHAVALFFSIQDQIVASLLELVQ